MKETIFVIVAVLALIGLCLIIGLIMRAFNIGSGKENDSGDDFMVHTMGDGCGIIIMLSIFVSVILFFIWLFL